MGGEGGHGRRPQLRGEPMAAAAAGGRLHAFNVGGGGAAGARPRQPRAAARLARCRGLRAAPRGRRDGRRTPSSSRRSRRPARDRPVRRRGCSLLAPLRRRWTAPARPQVAGTGATWPLPREEAARGPALAGAAAPAAGAARAVLKQGRVSRRPGRARDRARPAPASAPDAARASRRPRPRSPLRLGVEPAQARSPSSPARHRRGAHRRVGRRGRAPGCVGTYRRERGGAVVVGGGSEGPLADDIARFVYDDSGVERALGALNIPATCGVPPGSRCGADVAVLRAASADGAESSQNGFEVVVLEGAAPVDRASTRCARCSALSPG